MAFRQVAERPDIIERVASVIRRVNDKEMKMEERAMLAATMLRRSGLRSSIENSAAQREGDALLLRNRQDIIDMGMDAAANILGMLERSNERAAKEAIRIMRVLDKKYDASLGWQHFGEMEKGEGKLLCAMRLAHQHGGVSRNGTAFYGLTWFGHQIVELLENRERGRAARGRG
ncbi:MAG: hypothetical protein LVQ95_02330 [Candidatus Micrarchaeales archaeon]|nr:hypothetical protein [Candidatus Micrarchaeales archaeon]